MRKFHDCTARLAALLLLACLILPALCRPAPAHDLPGEMLITGYVKPAGERLALLLRIPLALFEGVGLPKRGPGYLDLANIEEGLDRSALAVARAFVLHEDGERIAPERALVRVAQPSDQSFASFEQARAHILGPPLPDETNVFWNQGNLDFYLDYAIASPDSSFALDIRAAPGLAGLLKLRIEFLPPHGAPRSFDVHGGHGWLELDPGWRWVAARFIDLGAAHILTGIEAALFLLCLVLPFRLQQAWRLAATLGAFALSHSLALWAIGTGMVSVDAWLSPVISMLIALSVLGFALDNIVIAWRARADAASLRWRWLSVLAFGLLYGSGFAAALAPELQFAGGHGLVALLAFNLGLELGQMALLLVAVPGLWLLLRNVSARRIAVVIISALIAHLAWHWAEERLVALKFVRWPELEAAWPGVLLALTLVLAGAVVGLVVRQLLRRRRARQTEGFGEASP
jgi:hypothetical protein